MRPTNTRCIEIGSGVVGLGTVAAGLWAMTAPRGFYLTVAHFPPYNAHLIHDIGAFQIGLGAGLVISLMAV